MGLADEIRLEQEHVDAAYGRLEELRAAARALADGVLPDSKGGTFADRIRRDVAVAASLARTGALTDDRPLCFGRLDREDGDTFHIGRVGVSDHSDDPLVVDWRAPVAEPFYRATPRQPLGLKRRRHLWCTGQLVRGLDDDVFDTTEDDGSLVGEAALMRALKDPRTGRMGDIVATIQAEQDEAIRRPLPGVLIIEGGPGTGKTAVALHRAAYLLYSHRLRLERDGVLVIGPNAVFLHYVEQVLPSIGETSVRLATIADLVSREEFTGRDEPRTAQVKGDPRMAELVARAVAQRQRGLPKELAIPFGRRFLKLSSAETRAIVKRVRQRVKVHNAGHELVKRALLRSLLAQAPELDERAAADSLAATTEFLAALLRMWPSLSPRDLLRDLFGSPALLAAAGRDLLTVEEQGILRRDRSSDAWTISDAALLDEAASLLGPQVRTRKPRERPVIDLVMDRTLSGMETILPSCRKCQSELTYVGGAKAWRCEYPTCGAEWKTSEVLTEGQALKLREILAFHEAQQPDPEPEERTLFGHVVVDEAQELTAMEWRMLARRCPSRSMTVVGDLLQSSGPAADWDKLLAPVTGDGTPERLTLSVNYRTPAQVAALAERFIRAVSETAVVPRAVRQDGDPPRFVPTDEAGLVAKLESLIQEEVEAVAPGRVGVILPASMPAPDNPRSLEEAAARLHLPAAKGLEFDSVILVEPGAILDEHGPGGLYVALTRTTRRLVLLHARPLPAALAD